MSISIDQEYEVVKIDGDFCPLREHPDNPNQGDDDIVEESVDANGWYGAITAQKSTGYILAGNTRFRVAQEKGASEIPVIWKDVDDETATKIMLADNQTARRASLDEEKVSELLASLPDLTGTGFDSVLHPLERDIEAGKVTLVDGTPRDGSAGDNEAVANVSVVPDMPTADSVPDDEYTPQYGVILVCATEDEQQEIYKLCKKTFGDQDIQVRLTAV